MQRRAPSHFAPRTVRSFFEVASPHGRTTLTFRSDFLRWCPVLKRIEAYGTSSPDPLQRIFLVPPNLSLSSHFACGRLSFRSDRQRRSDRLSWIWTFQISFLVPLAAVTSAHRWVAASPGIAVCLGRPATKRGARGQRSYHRRVRGRDATETPRRYGLFFCLEEPSIGQSRCRFDAQMPPIACHTSSRYRRRHLAAEARGKEELR